MFITVNDRPLNLFSIMYHYTRDVEKDGKTSYFMYYRLTDGRIIEEEFQNESDREARVAFVNTLTLGGLIQKNSYADFPTNGGAGSIYLAKDTGQVYYYDDKTGTYNKIGTAGKTGVYSTTVALPQAIGTATKINKSDLTEIVKPSVAYSDGSEVVGSNSVHALIVSSDATTVTVKTVTDLTIDSFIQVADETALPKTGASNVLYFLQDVREFRIWDDTSLTYIKPRQPQEVIEDITFDGTSDTYTLPPKVIEHDFTVYINSIRNFENDDYTIDKVNNTITFTTIYDTWDTCKIIYTK